ncbi:MAG: DUF4058 family protein [Planctomycetes bacterium]|nr:DUF4058 family protein [Planctomycetota bacterium]
MPVHDWTRVESGIYHAFHTTWTGEIQKTLNAGLLPPGYYVLVEQHAGRYIAEVLTLHSNVPPLEPPPLPATAGGTAVAEAPPKVRRRQVIEPAARARRRTLAVRHVTGHRLVALVEMVSPGNKDRAAHVEEFATKASSALRLGVHLLVVDLFPPGPHDPQGIHGAILERLEPPDASYELPVGEPLTLAGYAVGPQVEAYVEHLAVGHVLPQMPLFLQSDRYVNVPLEPTYEAAYRGMPAFWREVLEGRARPEP